MQVASRRRFVSPCQKGVFRLMNEDYFIEPVSSSPREEGAAQPHRIYKRQVPKDRAEQGRRPPAPRESCGVRGTVPASGLLAKFVTPVTQWVLDLRPLALIFCSQLCCRQGDDAEMEHLLSFP